MADESRAPDSPRAVEAADELRAPVLSCRDPSEVRAGATWPAALSAAAHGAFRGNAALPGSYEGAVASADGPGLPSRREGSEGEERQDAQSCHTHPEDVPGMDRQKELLGDARKIPREPGARRRYPALCSRVPRSYANLSPRASGRE